MFRNSPSTYGADREESESKSTFAFKGEILHAQIRILPLVITFMKQ